MSQHICHCHFIMIDRTNRRCDDTIQQTIHETHAGACGGHINGHALAKRTS